jgi:hypothetical protein
MNGMKRAQAAMEYLMTYGWALLVIVLVLGALIYLGVLNPQGRMQDMCNLPIGFGCEVAGLSTEGELYIKLTNQQAMPLEDLTIACKTSDGTLSSVTEYGTLNPGVSTDPQKFKCELPGVEKRNIGDFLNGEIEISYDTGVEKKIKGTFSAKVSVEKTTE